MSFETLEPHEPGQLIALFGVVVWHYPPNILKNPTNVVNHVIVDHPAIRTILVGFLIWVQASLLPFAPKMLGVPTGFSARRAKVGH